MKNVKMHKDKLLAIVETNRANHREIFEEALAGYVDFAKGKIDELAERLTKNGRIPESIHIPFPEDHTADYDRVILMLKTTDDPDVELTEREFAQYIQDEWGWQQQFLTSNSSYSTTARTTAASAGWI